MKRPGHRRPNGRELKTKPRKRRRARVKAKGPLSASSEDFGDATTETRKTLEMRLEKVS